MKLNKICQKKSATDTHGQLQTGKEMRNVYWNVNLTGDKHYYYIIKHLHEINVTYYVSH